MGSKSNKGLLHQYLSQLQRHPLRTKALTAGVLSGISDLVSQKLTGIQKIQLRRLLLKVLFGVAYLGPFGHFLYITLDKIFKGKRDSKTVAKKVLLEQLTSSPWNNLLFMIYYGFIIEGRPWMHVKTKIKKDYPSVQLTAWTFWPVVGWVNHQYVPLQFRGNTHSQSRYVKLKKDQAPLEEITPGELNQPIQVPQLVVHRCNECGQPLPESYQPPADEDWTTGICGCAEDTESCWTGLFCPCVLFGRNVENLQDIPWTNACVCHGMCVEGGLALAAATALFHGIDPKTSFLIAEGLLFSWWMCGIYTGLFRQSLQKKYHLKNSPCDPCLVHCCFHWCAICQEHREMKNHLSDNVAVNMTVVSPPPAQEMDTRDNKESTPSAPENGEQSNLEIQHL